jgi:choline dehydrogenase-like flavoprotein
MAELMIGRRSFEEYPEVLEIEADACVIGAGAGGCAGAAALSEAGLSVAVLEEGRHWKPRDFKPSTPWALGNLYQETGARAAAGNGLIMVNGGIGVGGSTLINSAICFKTPESVLSFWRDEHGCEALESGRFGALLDRVWRTVGAVKNPEIFQRNNNLIFKKGAEALGLRGDFLFRSAPGCTGCGVCNLGCPTGGKLSVDRSFLARALLTEQVGVYASCRAEGVETSGDRVVAVTGSLIDPATREPAGRFRVRAERFLLSGGPVGSPRFLRRNGLSTSEHCGEHLFLHPAAGVIGQFPFAINPWSGVNQGYYVDAYGDRHPAAGPGGDGGPAAAGRAAGAGHADGLAGLRRGAGARRGLGGQRGRRGADLLPGRR